MDFWTWFSIIYVFVTVTISFLFIEEKLRLVFMLIAFLLYVSIYNVHFSIKYYYKIRNEPGIKGDRGDPGNGGELGSDGVCAMAKSCGIASCRKLVVDTLTQKFPEYVVIRDKLNKNVELNSKEKKQNRQINTYIDLLVAKCEVFEKTEDTDGTDNTVNDFKQIIEQTIN
jgi:hypothetical protein